MLALTVLNYVLPAVQEANAWRVRALEDNG